MNNTNNNMNNIEQSHSIFLFIFFVMTTFYFLMCRCGKIKVI